jgi:nicotinamidase-related amidase
MESNSKNVDTALLIMDVQSNIVSRLEDSKELISTLKGAIGTARAAGIPIIYVVVGFRKGFPEISLVNKSFSPIRQNSAAMSSMEEPIAIYPAVAPQPGDIVVTKRRISAFTGSDLEVVLSGLGARHLVLTGIATSGVVLSTIREAADKDYRLTVLSDGCADMDNEVHTVLLTKVFPRQADVMTSEEWAVRLTEGSIQGS